MNLVVAGVGWAGERHVLAARALQRAGADVHVAALVDVDREHLARQAAALDVAATYTDLPSALAAHPDAEGVIIATPHHVHPEATEQTAAAGRHVLVEKPMALSLEGADAMIAACQRAGTTLMVAESARYGRKATVARKVLQEGTLGELLSGRINNISRGRQTYQYPGRRAWLADPAVCGGGIWMLNGIHTMSVARMLWGEVTRIEARKVRSSLFQSPLEASVIALLEFDSGAVVTMTVSAELHGYRRFGDLVVFGSEGTLHANWSHAEELTVYTQDKQQTMECASDEQDGVPGQFVRQMSEFLASVAEGREPYTSGRSERRTLAAIVAGYDSVRTGQPVVPAP